LCPGTCCLVGQSVSHSEVCLIHGTFYGYPQVSPSTAGPGLSSLTDCRPTRFICLVRMQDSTPLCFLISSPISGIYFFSAIMLPLRGFHRIPFSDWYRRFRAAIITCFEERTSSYSCFFTTPFLSPPKRRGLRLSLKSSLPLRHSAIRTGPLFF